MQVFRSLVVAAAFACAPAAVAQPLNDSCFSPDPVVPDGVPVPFDSTFAQTDGGSTCTPPGERDLWYTFTAPLNFNGALVATTVPPMVTGFYRDCPLGSQDSSRQLACSTTGVASIFVNTGQTYLVRVAMPAGEVSGTVAFTTRMPANDQCDIPAPAVVNRPDVTHIDFTFADSSAASTCSPAGTRDIWFRHQNGNTPQTLYVDPSDTFSESYIAAYTSCPSNPLDTSTQTACRVSNQGEVVKIPMAAGQAYLIRFATRVITSENFGTLQFWTRPTNDECADAQPVVLGAPMPFDATLGTKDGGSSCGGTRDIWYSYTASINATLEARPASTIASARVALFSACPTSPQDLTSELLCLGTTGGGAIMNFPVLAGQTYLIRVSTEDGGGFGSSITFNQVASPGNNTCSGSVPAIATGVAQAFNLAGATTDNATTCNAGVWDIWYSYTPAFNGTAAASFSAANFGLAVFSTCPSSPIDTSSEIDCISFSANQQLTFGVVSGQRYLLRISRNSAGTSTTGGNLTIAQQTPVPANNNCSGATPLIAGVPATAFTLVGATRDGSIGVATNARGTPDLWYSYAPATSTGATVTIGGTIAGASSAPTIGVFTACPSNPNDISAQVAAVAATGVPGRQVTFAAVGGQQYLIRVARRNGGTTHIAAGTIALTEFPAAQNDVCEGATPLVIGDNLINTAAALIDDDLSSTCGSTRDVWYTLDAPLVAASISIANLVGTSDSTVTVFESCVGPQVACGTSVACFPVVPGHRYLVRVTRGAFSSTAALSQTFTLRVTSFTAHPANDTCENATVVSEGIFSWGNQGACREVSNCGSGNDVWFRYEPSSTGSARAFIVDNTGTISRHLTCGGPAVQCDDELFPGVVMTFKTTVGVPVFIRVSGAAVAPDAGLLQIDGVISPDNDECVQALPVDVGFTFFDSTDATASNVLDACGIDGGNDLWYSYTAPRSGTVTFNTCRNAFTDDTGSYPAFSPSIWAMSNVSIFSACGVPLRCTDPINTEDTCGPAEPFRYPRVVYGPFYGSQTILIRLGTDVEGQGTGRLYVKYDATLCVGDFNNNGVTTVQDLFEFLAAYFAGNLRADSNQSGAVSVQDIFDYLAAFFAGCP